MSPGIRVLIPVWILLLSAPAGAFAQQATGTAGGNAVAGGASVSYTVGLPFYVATSVTAGSVTEGVQHVYDKTTITSVERPAGITCTVYPNPTGGLLHLKIEDGQLKDLRYSLYDVTGSLKESGAIGPNDTAIDMRELPPSAYFLRITNQRRELILTYKIIRK